MKKSAFGVGLFFLGLAVAQAAPSGLVSAPDRYRKCLALAAGNARAALDTAGAWSKAGGGVPARHCIAVALVGLGRYREAGADLDTLARDKGVAEVSLRAALLDQAGNAWMLGGDSTRAEASFAAALTLSARDADLFGDLARAKAMGKNWSAAESDLNEALALSPHRADLLVLRASARDALGRPRDAFADVDRALLAHPGDADALVERGTLKLEAGDKNGARKDWLAALASASRGEAANSARDHLATLGAPVKPIPAR